MAGITFWTDHDEAGGRAFVMDYKVCLIDSGTVIYG